MRVFKATNREFAERNMRGEHIILPLSRKPEEVESLYGLNETAYLVWKKACEGLDEENICVALLNEYEIDEETARADTEKALNELVERGLLLEA